jgi:hypothetical protein
MNQIEIVAAILTAAYINKEHENPPSVKSVIERYQEMLSALRAEVSGQRTAL